MSDLLLESYVNEDDRVTGRITVKSHRAFDTDPLFEIGAESGNMTWTTRINRDAALQIRDALSVWLSPDPDDPGSVVR